MRTLRIGSVSKATGLSVQAIRLYERRSLIPSPPRSNGGYRVYCETDIKRLSIVRHAQSLGFTLEEIGDLLRLMESQDDKCVDVCDRSRDKIAEINVKIKDLESIRSRLLAIVQTCGGSTEAASSCQIFQ